MSRNGNDHEAPVRSVIQRSSGTSMVRCNDQKSVRFNLGAYNEVYRRSYSTRNKAQGIMAKVMRFFTGSKGKKHRRGGAGVRDDPAIEVEEIEDDKYHENTYDESNESNSTRCGYQNSEDSEEEGKEEEKEESEGVGGRGRGRGENQLAIINNEPVMEYYEYGYFPSCGNGTPSPPRPPSNVWDTFNYVFGEY